MSIIHPYDTWVQGLIKSTDNDIARSMSITEDTMRKYAYLCKKFQVPLWYIQEFSSRGDFNFYKDIDGTDFEYTTLGFSLGDTVVENVGAYLESIKIEPLMCFTTVVLKDSDLLQYGKHFHIVDTHTIESADYESYLKCFSDKKKRYKIRKGYELSNSDEFQKGLYTLDVSPTLSIDEMQTLIETNPVLETYIAQTLLAVTQKYYSNQVYHAQSSLLWGFASGGKFIYNSCSYGKAAQFLINRNKGYWINLFFSCQSGIRNYLKGFLLESLKQSVWDTGDLYYTTTNVNVLDVFSTDVDNYAMYKKNLADSTRKCGLCASVDSSQEIPEWLQKPYFDVHTQSWVAE